MSISISGGVVCAYVITKRRDGRTDRVDRQAGRQADRQ